MVAASGNNSADKTSTGDGQTVDVCIVVVGCNGDGTGGVEIGKTILVCLDTKF